MTKEYEKDDTVDAILLWDVLKMQIRASSITYAKEYRAKQRQTEVSLERETYQQLNKNLREVIYQTTIGIKLSLN